MTLNTLGSVAQHTVGFAASFVKTFTIPAGSDGSDVPAVDLGKNYAFLILYCDDTTGLDSNTSLRLNLGYLVDDTLKVAHERNKPGTIWNSDALPQVGGFTVTLTDFLGARRVQIDLSKPVLNNTTFKFIGIDQATER